MGNASEFLKKYSFDHEILEIIIGGQSALDAGRSIRARTADEIVRFMACYGYDLENPIEKAELFGNFQEALSFIRRFFLHPENPEGIKIEIPRKIAELTDIHQLIVMANTPSDGNPTQALISLWACAITKVMHTISHMDKDLRSHYFTAIQTQILDRFYKFIHSDQKSQVFLGKDVKDSDRIDLVSFDSKPKKKRDSLILKLLHKPENVAEDIFDRVGIRFVTKTKFDSLRIVRFLRDHYVMMPANIKPSRSRNNLIDIKMLILEVEKIKQEMETKALTTAELETHLDKILARPFNSERDDPNPHSSKHFRSLQFTCRQLIKFKNPLYDELKELKTAVQNTPVPEKISKIIERLDLSNIQKEIRFFYPYEVQVFDEANFLESQAGRSSHTNYKKSQIYSAMCRVMGPLMRFANHTEPSVENA